MAEHALNLMEDWNEATRLIFLSAVCDEQVNDAITETTNMSPTPSAFLGNLVDVAMTELAKKMISRYEWAVVMEESDDPNYAAVRMASALWFGLMEHKPLKETTVRKQDDGRYLVVSKELLENTPFENSKSASAYLEKLEKENCA